MREQKRSMSKNIQRNHLILTHLAWIHFNPQTVTTVKEVLNYIPLKWDLITKLGGLTILDYRAIQCFLIERYS